MPPAASGLTAGAIWTAMLERLRVDFWTMFALAAPFTLLVDMVLVQFGPPPPKTVAEFTPQVGLVLVFIPALIGAVAQLAVAHLVVRPEAGPRAALKTAFGVWPVFLAALMLRDGRIDPRCFTPEAFGDPVLQAMGARLTIAVDDNPDPNALGPQRFVLAAANGRRREIVTPATFGSPANPLSPAWHAGKLAFARSLAVVPVVAGDPLAVLCGMAA